MDGGIWRGIWLVRTGGWTGCKWGGLAFVAYLGGYLEKAGNLPHA